MMTRILFYLWAFSFPSITFATADSPVVQGLAGAGRAGLSKESLFLNPASSALNDKASAFYYYTKSKIPDFNAGGRSYSVGAYDGQNPEMKGAFAYTRTARARVSGGAQTYEDRSEIRFDLGREVSGGILGGLGARYVTNRVNGAETKFIQGDIGTIFNLFSDIRAGITYEDIRKITGERPPTLGGGIQYGVAQGIQVFADGTRIMSGDLSGKKSYSIALELGLAGDFSIRGGKFLDAYRANRGYSLGISWNGPRASFDYGLRMTSNGHQEKDHIFGMIVLF